MRSRWCARSSQRLGPDLTRVRHQIGVLSTIATRFLIPDNHIGRATVSSVAVADDLTVRSMIDMARDFVEDQRMSIRIGVSCGLGAVPAWKYDADAWYLQVSYDLDAIVTWRAGIEFDGGAYAGVMALPSACMARNVSADVPQLAVPRLIVDRLDANPNAGFDLAVEFVLDVRDSNAFDGAHLVPVNRYRQVAAALEPALR